MRRQRQVVLMEVKSGFSGWVCDEQHRSTCLSGFEKYSIKSIPTAINPIKLCFASCYYPFFNNRVEVGLETIVPQCRTGLSLSPTLSITLFLSVVNTQIIF
ncbi:hypothetical protein DFA_06348 [Cavenderia fasciculata]|uniref:Uncharacterized protein n=1 Tax=Cavenderia fasciculata TaxID=261658 RepID=F4PKS7_CACFS|nr:uncharacterized protein DFA_06348 [Cavenderia fasciculata]EGG24201.1 hypothetical protein DFA_06348 [Cavenderia fasciculata]|eukprot:XP_004362052.1 hypothetical protein DFA_06348 [Cavenderia fasciculata]